MVSTNNANPSPLSLKVFPLPFPLLVNPSIEQSADDTIGASLPPVNISIVVRLSGVRFFKNVFNPLKISFQLKSSKNPRTNFQNPSTHPLIASAHCSHLNFLKKRLNPCATFLPNVLNLNLSVNPFDANIAVFNAPAITSAVAVNTLFPFLSSENRPFKKLANPVPNLSAFL